MKLKNIIVLTALLAVMAIYACTANAEAVQTLNLPANLEVVGEQAFFQATSLNKVIVPEGTTTIEGKAFAYSSLQEISLPRSLTSIAEDAFEGCGQFKVKVPMNCYAYNWCLSHGYIGKPNPTPAEYFTYATINGLYARITGYTGTDTIVVIPEEIDDYIIQKVSDNTFKNNKTIEYVYVPDTVKQIGASAFYGCTSLVGVDVGHGVETIGGSAFYGCASLIGIDFPESLTTTGSSLFENCINLEYFDYPINWSSAGSNTIAGCSKISELTIPEGAKIIPQNAFMNCYNIVSLYISSTIETIGIDSFKNCTGLTEITIPGNVQTLGGFTSCTNLHTVTIKNGVSIISDNTFENCTSLTSISLPNTLSRIGYCAFRNCLQMGQIDLPDGLAQIDSGVFQGCTSLVELNLPDTVVSVGSMAFADCTNLSSFHYPAGWSTTTRGYPDGSGRYDFGNHFLNCTKLRKIEIPEGVETIPDYTFYNAKYVRTIILPSTIKSFGYWAFRNCEAITSIDIPNGLESIDSGAFNGCVNLIQLNLPDSVTSIGSMAFANCTNLSSFHYPAGWTTTTRGYPDGTGHYDYGNHFLNCTNLQYIEIPNGASMIPNYAFSNAPGLIEVTTPDSLTSIGKEAFSSCQLLEKVYLGYSVNSIGSNAFKNCPALTIWTEYGAYALQYAKDNGIPYYYLTPDGVNSPSGTLYKGDSYALYGYARASVPLTNVTATIWDSTGTNVLQTISVNPATTDYSLSGTVNASLLFGNLQLGSYRYTLSARTDVSEEVWADVNFKIVPPPLRIYISGACFPDGLTDVGSGFNITGTVISNYAITRLTISLFTADGVERYTNSVNPGTLTYSLSDLAGNIPIASLPVGNYSIRIISVANGETRILADKSFQPVDLDGEVDEATVEAVVNFVSDNSNANLFPSKYVNSALGRMNASDVLIMAINSRNSWVYGMASTLFTENHENLYLVDLYESELADIIADMNPNTIQLENISSTEKLVADALMDYGTNILDIFQENSSLNSTTTEFLQEDFTELSSKLKKIKDGVKGTKMSIELANNLSKAMCNYVNGLEILTMVSDSMGTNNSSEFKLAVQRMHAKYKSESFNVVMNMLELFTKELINMSTKEITTAMVNLGSELGSKVNGGMLYSIVNFAIDASMKLTGYSDIADDYQTFMIQVEAYNTGRNTYENAFYAVKGGDTSARAINRLLVAFTYTKQSSLRIHETISTLRSTPTDEMKNILDYTTKLKNTSITN